MKRLVPIFVAFAIAGCRTVNDVIVDYRSNRSGGNYAAAAKEPAGVRVRSVYSPWRTVPPL